jgi:hypothetical protein
VCVCMYVIVCVSVRTCVWGEKKGEIDGRAGMGMHSVCLHSSCCSILSLGPPAAVANWPR